MHSNSLRNELPTIERDTQSAFVFPMVIQIALTYTFLYENRPKVGRNVTSIYFGGVKEDCPAEILSDFLLTTVDHIPCKNTLYCRFALQKGKFSKLGGDSPHAPLGFVPESGHLAMCILKLMKVLFSELRFLVIAL